MHNTFKAISASLLVAVFVIAAAVSQSQAQSAAWRVSKSSGDVWVSTSGVQPVSLTQDAVLNPGDSIRTGRNGRVLLVRGEEKILVSPNSVVGIPTEKGQGKTTIIQQSGTILIEVEKRPDQHFEVETPYLAAVVRGTQFRVSVSRSESYVNVLRGQVEVTDFRSGQSALVLPGQMAKVWAIGNAGLRLSGSGTLNPVRLGPPRTTSVVPVPTSDEGPSAPVSATTGQQVLLLPPSGDAASVPISFDRSGSNDTLWNATVNYVCKLFGKADGAPVREDREAAIIAIPVGFGALIAVVVAVRRRRQKQKQK